MKPSNTASNQRPSPRPRLSWMVPILMLAPLVAAPKGCDSGVVGDECPPGSTSPRCTDPDESCGGLLGGSCDDGEYCDLGGAAQCGAADQTGVCRPVPDGCTADFDPVCGCDDVTYSNACQAARAGVSVAFEVSCEDLPPSGETCGGLLGLACARGEYCNFAIDAQCGAADQTGACTPLPQGCDDVLDPVCGCDDQTYSNACEAARAGVSVAQEGACDAPPDGTVCGGLQGAACARGEYCNFPLDALCGAADATGVCAPIPAACDAVLDPVCGCDDQTYGNACEAALAGVSVAAPGACAEPPTGDACGGLRGLTCSDGEYCNFPADALCGRADATGTCAVLPRGCTRELDPVCGCDGLTYANPCTAAAAGVSVEHAGACGDGMAAACGGLLGLRCGSGEFCDYPIEALCGAADQTGVCRPLPGACITVVDPVCGCDGRTYGNRCLAAQAGVAVGQTGACP